MVVEQYMTVDPITVGPDTILHKALELLQTHRIRHLPVVEGKRLVGIISDRDLRQILPSFISDSADVERFRARGKQVRVGEVMIRRVISVTPDTQTHKAARLMVEHRIGCLPVLRGSTLVGIVTTIDLLQAMAGLDQSQATSLEKPRTRERKPREDRRVPRVEAGRGRR